MGPKKRNNEVVKNTTRNIQLKRGPKEKITTKDLSLRVDVPSKNVTKNSGRKVVATQALVSQKPLTKDNNDKDIQPTKLVLRSKTALKNQANAENVNSKAKSEEHSTKTNENPKKPLITDTTVAKMMVKHKATRKRHVNKSTSETNKSQVVDTVGSAVEESNCAKRRKTNAQKGITLTFQTNNIKDIKPTNNAKECLGFKLSRLTRSSSTMKSAPSSRPKRVVNNTKGKNITEITDSKSIQDASRTLSKDRSNNFNITFNGPKPAPVESRQLSVSNECMSWIRDISTTSTTTCFTVHSDEYVRFDEKLPLVKLTDVTHATNIVSDEKTNDEISKRLSNNDNNVLRASTRSLPLSSISESDTDDEIISERCDDNDKNPNSFPTLLNKLTASLKHFDIEIMNWISYNSKDSDLDMQTDSEKFYSVFNSLNEGEVMLSCRNIKKIILDDDYLNTDDKINDKADREDAEVFNIDLSKPNTDVKNNSKIAQNSSATHIKETEYENRYDTAKHNHANDSNDDVCNDDDDALSLFAESITGFESSKNNNSLPAASIPIIRDFDEYVPQSFNQNSMKANDAVSSYHPTKINKDLPNESPLQYKSRKIICEKQTADSTSIHKESKVNENEIYRKHFEDTINSQKLNDDTASFAKLLNSTNTKEKQTVPLVSFIYKPVLYNKSAVFTGVCFFNLAYKCINSSCHFKHAMLDAEVVKTRLRFLNETAFIQEYMLMRISNSLRKQYGTVFLDDCIRRNLTTLLFEMAIDYIKKSNSRNDQEQMVKIVETILLYLNTTDLTAYADYLLFILHTDTTLCDGFMNIIAETQNFTRFKSIFIKLSNFFCEVERNIKHNVATSLLVRLAILPYEEPLAEALLKVIKMTSPNIFKNAMISHLESQLLLENEVLYHELQMMKSTVEQTASSNFTMLQSSDYNFDNANTNMHTETNSRCSPDTTRLDCLNKTFNTRGKKQKKTPSRGSDATAPLLFSISNQNFTGRNNNSCEDFSSSSTAAGQIGGFARPRFQERPSFTNMQRHRVPNRKRPTIKPGKLQYKFNKT